jgi:hypothetical protein
VKVIDVHASAGRGVCWARRLTQLLWDGESHTLVIDSHMRMVEHWDELCLAQLDACPTPRALLSGTPAAYTPPDRLEPNPRPTILRADFFNPAGEMRCKGVVLSTAPAAPLRGAFLAAGLMFSRAEVIEEVPYDPHCYFNQEEVSYAIRLWSHGWDIYHPSRVIAYHHYLRPGDDREGVPARPLHWGDCPEWGTYQAIGLARFNLLTEHAWAAPQEARVALERHGLGGRRSLDSFQEFCGVDFRAKTVSRHALTCGFISGLERWLPQPVHVPELAAPADHPERIAQLRP